MCRALVTVLHWEVMEKWNCLWGTNVSFPAIYLTILLVPSRLLSEVTLRSEDGDGNGNATKAIGLISKQQFCTCVTLFCTFLCRHCTITTWKCLISRCTEEVHKRRQNFLIRQQPSCVSRVSKSRAFLSLARLVWRTRGRLYINRVRSLFRSYCWSLGWARYSFEPRPYSRVISTERSLARMTIGFFNKGIVALGKPVWW